MTVQDEERAEIARDLHDEVGPFLFAVDVDAQTIPALLARSADDDVISPCPRHPPVRGAYANTFAIGAEPACGPA